MPAQSDLPEGMAEFFDRRADGYDAHMQRTVEDFHSFYAAVASSVAPTEEAICILDLGAGTGAELAGILAQAPRARITAVDVSQNMLDRLRSKYRAHAESIECVQASFTETQFATATFDYVVSVMALHHHLPEGKLALYRRIWCSIRPGGVFVNGDYISEGGSAELDRVTARLPDERHPVPPPGGYHVDIPLSVQTERDLLERAGFGGVFVPFRRPRAAVLVARRPGPLTPVSVAHT